MIDLGQVFDIYDDGGALLLEKTAGELPDGLRDLDLLPRDKAARLPDNVFAGVLCKEGEQVRKWPCHDRGHTALSCLYFLKTAHQLPGWAREKVASNLESACNYFGIEPPRLLIKHANRLLLQTDGAEILVNKRGGKTQKKAEMTGTRYMPLTAKAPGPEKISSVIEDPYIDLTGERVEKVAEDYDDDWYALVSEKGGRQFPLVSFSQIKEAADHFRENMKRLHPRTRREYCTKLAARASAVGVPVSDDVERYGAESYASGGEIKMAFDMRRSLIVPELTGHLEELFEKRAELDPDVFAEVLSFIDIKGGIDKHWDSLIPDPWATTFGAEKRAAWRWVYGNTVLDEEELRRLAVINRKVVEQAFGSEFAEELERDPTVIFDSMPLDKKQVLARLAQTESRS